MSVKCFICKSGFNLLFACNPGTVGGPNDILCERCYAKTAYVSEYPNLSQHALTHIKSLPHLASNVELGSIYTVSPQQTNFTTFPQLATPQSSGFGAGFGVPSNSYTVPTFNSNPTFGFPQNTKPTTKTTIKEVEEKLRRNTEQEVVKLMMLNGLTSQSFTNTGETASTAGQSNIPKNPTNIGTTNSDNPNRTENAKRLNEFIKKALFPELMEFPELEPKTKTQKLENSSGETEDEEEDRADWPFEWIGGDVKSIKDLIRISRDYKTNPKRVQTNLDMDKLVRLIEPLETLQDMVGLEDIKDSIFKQVVFHLQDLDNGNKDMHHTVIKGPPGVGKTQISHIIAKIYKGLGFLKKDTVVSVKRDDLIAGYLGQTAMKAKKKYEEALGGVLLIDEAYALGDGSDKDSYSKEAIDLLTSYLSEHGNEFICIIAGYKEALEKRFFSVNEGLARRFNIHYEIKPYSGTDICQIFQKLVGDGGWQLDASAYNPEFFVANLDAFPHFGGDMLNLFAYTKKAHSSRLLSIRTKEQLMNTKKKINMDDLEAGFEQYIAGNGYAKKDTPFDAKFMYM